MQEEKAERWLAMQADFGRARNTLLAYRRALRDYLEFCTEQQVQSHKTTREHIALYVRSLTDHPVSRRGGQPADAPSSGLANATLRQRLTVIRLYHDYLICA